MKKEKEQKLTFSTSFSVLGRILRDAKPILPWLGLAVLIDLAAVTLTMLGPDLLGRLTDML